MPRASDSSVPSDFGRLGGTPISNKDSLLDEVDKALETRKPKIEYLLVRPTPVISLPFGYSLSYNSYGHAAVRYCHPDGRDIVMNIEGKDRAGKNMVNFYEAKEYLFGLEKSKVGEQVGIYNRDIVSIRVHDVSDENILAMHNYYLSLQEGYSKGKFDFNLFMGPIYNLLSYLFPNMALTGNCAWWTSQGLLRAKVVTKTTLWPKSIWINMFENYEKTEIKEKSNMSVVYYKRIPHCYHTYGTGGNENSFTIDAVAPLQSLRSLSYFNLQSFADVVVHVPKGSIIARVDRHAYPSEPSKFRNIVNSPYTVMGSVVGTLFLLRKHLSLRRRGRRAVL